MNLQFLAAIFKTSKKKCEINLNSIFLIYYNLIINAIINNNLFILNLIINNIYIYNKIINEDP